MIQLPTLDAHTHLDFTHTPDELAASGAVLAMTLSLKEATSLLERSDPLIAWGVGCHPRKLKAQEAFNPEQFFALCECTAIVGEIGLDTVASVPLELQLRTFRQALEILSNLPRLVSIHSYRATGLVIEELRRRPISIPVLHWWTGSAAETSAAVELGCYFSIHSAVVRHSKFRTRVPRERLLIESDQSYADPPAAIPLRIALLEYLLAQQHNLEVKHVRQLAWQNLNTIVRKTGTLQLLPKGFIAILTEIDSAIQTSEQGVTE